MAHELTETQTAFVRGTFKTRYRRKLTPAQLDEIVVRKADGEKPMDLALEYGVTAVYIRAL